MQAPHTCGSPNYLSPVLCGLAKPALVCMHAQVALQHLTVPCAASCREMRKFDEEGQPEPEAVEFGEFLIKVCCVHGGPGGCVHGSPGAFDADALDSL